MANIVYTNLLTLLASGTLDLTTDPIYAMLLSGTYVPSTGHKLVTEVTSHQSVDPLASYQPGGRLLSSKTIGISAGQVVFDAADVTWSSATITASGVALWASGSTASTRYLLCWQELGNQTSTNGTFQIVWNPTNGIFRIGAS